MSNSTDSLHQTSTETNEVSSTARTLVVPRAYITNVVIAVAFFALGAATAGFVLSNSARSVEQIINQAVAVAVNESDEGQGSPSAANIESPGTRLEVSVDDDPSNGPLDAPITIVEFSDFNCPYCARFRRDTLPLILENYGDQVRFVYRDFAILGPSSVDAAIASECADEQSAFWFYHDLLFENQRNFNREMLIGYAQQIDLRLEEFASCLDDPEIRTEVMADTEEAQRLGATGTPTFFINGRPLVGAQPFEVFASIIDDELAALTAPNR
ncbi:MAG: DsbA family protein [Anaerolineae bacterium]|nr:DsbA family protein [Anaerolineae bacterium]